MRQLKITTSITARTTEALERYLNDIGREPLLTPDEEAMLAHTIHKGGKEGEAARDRLIRANLRFVVSVAKQYQHQGISLIDLINEGNLGLMRAAEKYDETRGFKFISYAVWWIRQSIMEALAQKSRLVRVPLNQMDMALRVNRATQQFLQDHGRLPSIHELAAQTGLDEAAIAAAQDANSRAVSIDAPLSGDNEDNSLADSLSSDDPHFQADNIVDRESMRTTINGLINDVLTPRESRIVREAYGIGTTQRSLEEIAQELHMTRERIRQVREKAIRKLKRSPEAGGLKEYL